jgi:hypothetical protein
MRYHIGFIIALAPQMKIILTLLLLIGSFVSEAQKVESITFNLYTDSLKKGVHNYINVDGKMSNGSFYPLMADEIEFSSSAGKWQGNSIIIDSTYKKDSVVITAKLKSNPVISRSVTVYMKKILIEPPLKTEKELLEDWKKNNRKKSLVG